MENKVILLVEDNARDEALARRALKQCKIPNEVVVARDGVEALDYLFGTGKYAGRDLNLTPQLILLDLKLPKVDGLEVLRRIRSDERTRHLPAVIFTSSVQEEDLISSYNLGANSFVRKPVERDQFLEATKQLGLYWLGLNRVARVLIANAHEVIRDGLKKILDEQQPGTTAYGEAGTAHEVLKLAREQDWDVAVLDPDLSATGLDVLKDLKQVRPGLPVLILSMRSEDVFARRALKAGASGYITTDSPRAELVKAVHKVMSGGRYVSAALTDKLIFDRGISDRAPHDTLSDREFEVLRLIASGKTVSQVAAILSLSDSTISTYRARILDKMGMKTNAELTHYAIQNKLVN